MIQCRAGATARASHLLQRGGHVDKKRPAPALYEWETTVPGVREAILDLAENFLVLLCKHWTDVSVRALEAERYAVRVWFVCSTSPLFLHFFDFCMFCHMFFRCFSFSLFCHTLVPSFAIWVHFDSTLNCHPAAPLLVLLVWQFLPFKRTLPFVSCLTNFFGSCHCSASLFLLLACHMCLASVAKACTFLHMLLFFVLTFFRHFFIQPLRSLER